MAHLGVAGSKPETNHCLWAGAESRGLHTSPQHFLGFWRAALPRSGHAHAEALLPEAGCRALGRSSSTWGKSLGQLANLQCKHPWHLSIFICWFMLSSSFRDIWRFSSARNLRCLCDCSSTAMETWEGFGTRTRGRTPPRAITLGIQQANHGFGTVPGENRALLPLSS